MREYLREYGTGRRTLNKLTSDKDSKDRFKYLEPSQMLRVIHRNKWEYKQDVDFYEKRDLALASLLYLSSGRINEVLRLRVNQIIPDDDPEFMIIQAFYVSKRKEGKDHPILDIPLPLAGKLKPFTMHVLDYVKLLKKPDEPLFKFSRARAWAIIRTMTAGPDTEGKGWFCHWFRAQSLSYHVNLIRSTVAVASQRGVENPATLMKYYRGDWKQYKDELKQ